MRPVPDRHLATHARKQRSANLFVGEHFQELGCFAACFQILQRRRIVGAGADVSLWLPPRLLS